MYRWLSLTALGLVGVTMMSRPAPSSQDEPKPAFAGDRVAAAVPVAIDGKRAMDYLKQVCAIGPRVSGTKGMTKQQEMLQDHFQRLGAAAELQKFKARQVSRPGQIEMANLVVSFHPNRQRRVILCCHYDTRPIADQEEDPRKWREPFLSANDGGSGVAFLMELGHHVPQIKTGVGIDFVFFDGEEYVWEPKRDKYFLGSQHFAAAWRDRRRQPDYQAAVLLDMIAGQNPRFPAEGYSYYRARPLVNQLWQIAAEQKCDCFQMRVGDHVQDDHLALQNVGIPAIDIIDFSYPHWHRLTDTPENCSPEGLEQVAKVLTVWLQRLR